MIWSFVAGFVFGSVLFIALWLKERARRKHAERVIAAMKRGIYAVVDYD